MARPNERVANAASPKQQHSELDDRDLRMLVEGVQDFAIYLLDPSGQVMSWNRGAERIKGYQADEIIGKHFSVFLPPEEVKAGKPAQELRIAAEQGRFEDENWRLRKDGSRFWANVVITALRDEQGTLRGFAKITRDLTQRRQAEEDLQRANESLQQELKARQRAEEAIRALSTPVLPVREELLVLPIIGVIDSSRAFQLTEQLLNAIRSYRAKCVVMDITGVPLVDSRVANHLLQTVEAARLMGATVLVTGLSPDIAQTLVRIGVDLSRLKTLSDLRAGLEEAEQLLGYELVRTGDKPPSTK